MRAVTLPEKPRILIVRLSAIGDTVHSLPLAAALRRARPEAYLGWLVEKPASALIEGNPLLDWVGVVPKGWLKKPSEVLRLRRALREQGFTHVFDVQGLTKSAVAGWLSGAPVRIGFSRGEGRELAPLLDTVKVAPEGRHIIDKSLSLLRGAGIAEWAKAEFVLPACAAGDRTAIDAFLAGEGLDEKFVLMGPWGSFAAKLWPLERFLELAAVLRERTGLRSVMLGHGDGERSRVKNLVEKGSGELVMAPDVGLTGVAELARRARLFVGCDSFPMHAASAVGCRTLGLFGVTDPERLGPYGGLGGAACAHLTLPASTRERRELGPENMEALTVAAVAEACLGLLERGVSP